MNLCDHNPVWRLILAKMSEIRSPNVDQVTFFFLKIKEFLNHNPYKS